MEVKRAAELVLCNLLREALPTLLFYPSQGGGDDLTPMWQPNFDYVIGDLIRSNNTTKTRAIIITEDGTSGASEPAFNDVPGSSISSGATYFTTNMLVDFNAQPRPPYAVVLVDKAEKTMSTKGTSFVSGRIVWTTRMTQTDPLVNSISFKQIYDALASIKRGFDPARSIIVHGIDITSTEEQNDDNRYGRGHSIFFTMGVTEIPGWIGPSGASGFSGFSGYSGYSGYILYGWLP